MNTTLIAIGAGIAVLSALGAGIGIGIAACIGPVTADTAKSLGIEPDIIAKEYTIDGLVEAICK